MKVVADGFGTLESVGVDSRGRLFFTDSQAGELLMIRRRGAEPRVIADGIDAPGGIVFQRHSGSVLVGFGNSSTQAIDGPANPEAGLLRVNPKTGETRVHTEGLQMANGIARAPGRTLFASNALSGGIDRIDKTDGIAINWAPIPYANGITLDEARESLFANQTLGASVIQRVPLGDPGAAAPYWSAPGGEAGGLDGLARGDGNRLYAAANLAGEVWRVDGPDGGCVLVEREPFPAGPSDAAFGRPGGGFGRDNLYVTTFGGELLELQGARS